jgi:hypothetical protein
MNWLLGIGTAVACGIFLWGWWEHVNREPLSTNERMKRLKPPIRCPEPTLQAMLGSANVEAYMRKAQQRRNVVRIAERILGSEDALERERR